MWSMIFVLPVFPPTLHHHNKVAQSPWYSHDLLMILLMKAHRLKEKANDARLAAQAARYTRMSLGMLEL